MIFLTLLLIVFVLAPIVYLLRRRKTITFPAGTVSCPTEYGVPVLGVIPQIEGLFHEYLHKLSEKHGPIYRIKLGMRDVIILDDYQSIKKAFKDDGSNFAGRWRAEIMKQVNNNCGVIFNDGEVAIKQRSFMLRVLRDFGVGTSKMNDMVQSECTHLMEEIRATNGKSTDFASLIAVFTANIIAKFIMNKRFSREDPIFLFIDEHLMNLVTKKDYLHMLFLMFPFTDHSMIISVFLYWISGRKHAFDKAHQIFADEIKEHRKRIDYNTEGEDLIDRFLIEQKRLIEKNGTEDTFTDFQLVRNSFELFLAGYETTSTTLCWSLLLLCKHPQVQEKMFEEIVAQIGMDRMPTLSDKKDLVYTQSVMDEILRLSSILPLSVFHRSIQDTNINGIFIPKNSFIIPNLFACSRDASVWQRPNEFYPEHFLVTNDNGEIKYNPREELIPFGVGKRQCLGESLARAEFFIFLVGIIQQFCVTFDKELTDKEYHDALVGNDGLIRRSKIKYFKFQGRSSA